MKWLRRREGRLSPHEQERLADFAALSIRDIRTRADEFAEAQKEYRQWLIVRRAQRDHVTDGKELEGYAPEVQSGDPAARWRELERELRERGLWTVGEMEDDQQVRWAKRLNALSATLSQPQRRRVGPEPPSPIVRPVDPTNRRADRG